MNQKRYLQELAYYLRSLPKDVQDQIIKFYEDEFNKAKNEGRSEEDTILLLGRPKANAEKELAIYADQIQPESSFDSNEAYQSEEKWQSVKQMNQPINYGMLILLIVVNIIFVLGPAVGILFAGFGLWLSSISLMATPLIVFWFNGAVSFPEFYPVMAAVGLGILLFVAMNYLSKLASRLIRAYFDAMKRMVRGE